MSTFTLRQKLYLGFISIAAVAVLSSVVSLWQIVAMHDDFKAVVQKSDTKADGKDQKSESDRLDDSYSGAVTTSLVFTLGAAGLGLWLAFFITRGAMRQLGGDPEYVKGVIDRMAKGDFSQAVQLAEGDSASVLAAMASMQRELGDILQRARAAVHAMASASAQIAKGNVDLSSRTEEQASSLQEIASAMEELAGTVGHNAENARLASQLADNASSVARTGGETVKRVVNTMNDIAASSQRTQEIIGVIDGIAFETNVLALNAADEAARAGEQGRGFALVAAEVGNLAQRSAEAAKEIKALITESVFKAGSGAKLVHGTGAQMDEIVTAVQRVTDIVGKIAAASAEQSSGINHVSQSVARMDQTTQQNASLVEQAAAAASSLEDQSKGLVAAVSVFALETAKRGTPFSGQWDSLAERRGPNRATNVKRIYGHDGKRLVEPAPERSAAASRTAGRGAPMAAASPRAGKASGAGPAAHSEDASKARAAPADNASADHDAPFVPAFLIAPKQTPSAKLANDDEREKF